MNTNTAVEDYFLATIGELAASSEKKYRWALDLFLEEFGEDDIHQLDHRRLRRWRANLLESYKRTTANTILRVVRRFLNWYGEECGLRGEAFANPGRVLAAFRVDDDTLPRAVEPDGVLALVRQAQAEKNWKYLAIILTLYCTGGRVSGAIKLTLDDVDWTTGRTWVVEKGGKGRWIFLEETALAAVKKYVVDARPESEHREIFLNRWGGPYSRQSIWYMLRRLADRAGVTCPVNPHAFRHGFSIEYLRSGGDLASLQQLLGHATVETTARYYARFASDQLRELHGRHNPINQLRPNRDMLSLLRVSSTNDDLP